VNYDPTGNFPGSGEQGLTGIAVDPQSGDLFVSALHSEDDVHHPRIWRLHSLDGGRTAASRSLLLDMQGELQGESHQISCLNLGPDGRLYAHNGDGFDIAQSQSLTSFRGKILRLEVDGSPAEDNPFYVAE